MYYVIQKYHPRQGQGRLVWNKSANKIIKNKEKYRKYTVTDQCGKS